MGDLGLPEPFGDLATVIQPASPTPISIQPFGRDVGQAIARAIPRSEASQATLKLRLLNDGAICYVNANLIAFLWGMLQSSANWSDFENGETL